MSLSNNLFSRPRAEQWQDKIIERYYSPWILCIAIWQENWTDFLYEKRGLWKNDQLGKLTPVFFFTAVYCFSDLCQIHNSFGLRYSMCLCSNHVAWYNWTKQGNQKLELQFSLVPIHQTSIWIQNVFDRGLFLLHQSPILSPAVWRLIMVWCIFLSSCWLSHDCRQRLGLWP